MKYLFYVSLFNMALWGCNREDAPIPTTTQPLTTSTVEVDNPYAVNRHGIRSKSAQSLRYPPGADTAAYWKDGRFEIMFNFLYDKKKSSTSVFGMIHSLRQKDQWVYCIGCEGGILILNLETENYHQYKDLESVPAEHHAVISLMDNLEDPENIFFNPITRRPYSRDRE